MANKPACAFGASGKIFWTIDDESVLVVYSANGAETLASWCLPRRPTATLEFEAADRLVILAALPKGTSAAELWLLDPASGFILIKYRNLVSVPTCLALAQTLDCSMGSTSTPLVAVPPPSAGPVIAVAIGCDDGAVFRMNFFLDVERAIEEQAETGAAIVVSLSDSEPDVPACSDGGAGGGGGNVAAVTALAAQGGGIAPGGPALLAVGSAGGGVALWELSGKPAPLMAAWTTQNRAAVTALAFQPTPDSEDPAAAAAAMAAATRPTKQVLLWAGVGPQAVLLCCALPEGSGDGGSGGDGSDGADAEEAGASVHMRALAWTVPQANTVVARGGLVALLRRPVSSGGDRPRAIIVLASARAGHWERSGFALSAYDATKAVQDARGGNSGGGGGGGRTGMSLVSVLCGDTVNADAFWIEAESAATAAPHGNCEVEVPVAFVSVPLERYDPAGQQAAKRHYIRTSGFKLAVELERLGPWAAFGGGDMVDSTLEQLACRAEEVCGGAAGLWVGNFLFSGDGDGEGDEPDAGGPPRLSFAVRAALITMQAALMFGKIALVREHILATEDAATVEEGGAGGGGWALKHPYMVQRWAHEALREILEAVTRAGPVPAVAEMELTTAAAVAAAAAADHDGMTAGQLDAMLTRAESLRAVLEALASRIELEVSLGHSADARAARRKRLAPSAADVDAALADAEATFSLCRLARLAATDPAMGAVTGQSGVQLWAQTSSGGGRGRLWHHLLRRSGLPADLAWLGGDGAGAADGGLGRCGVAAAPAVLVAAAAAAATPGEARALVDRALALVAYLYIGAAVPAGAVAAGGGDVAVAVAAAAVTAAAQFATAAAMTPGTAALALAAWLADTGCADHGVGTRGVTGGGSVAFVRETLTLASHLANDGSSPAAEVFAADAPLRLGLVCAFLACEQPELALHSLAFSSVSTGAAVPLKMAKEAPAAAVAAATAAAEEGLVEAAVEALLACGRWRAAFALQRHIREAAAAEEEDAAAATAAAVTAAAAAAAAAAASEAAAAEMSGGGGERTVTAMATAAGALRKRLLRLVFLGVLRAGRMDELLNAPLDAVEEAEALNFLRTEAVAAAAAKAAAAKAAADLAQDTDGAPTAEAAAATPLLLLVGFNLRRHRVAEAHAEVVQVAHEARLLLPPGPSEAGSAAAALGGVALTALLEAYRRTLPPAAAAAVAAGGGTLEEAAASAATARRRMASIETAAGRGSRAAAAATTNGTGMETDDVTFANGVPPPRRSAWGDPLLLPSVTFDLSSGSARAGVGTAAGARHRPTPARVTVAQGRRLRGGTLWGTPSGVGLTPRSHIPSSLRPRYERSPSAMAWSGDDYDGDGDGGGDDSGGRGGGGNSIGGDVVFGGSSVAPMEESTPWRGGNARTDNGGESANSSYYSGNGGAATPSYRGSGGGGGDAGNKDSGGSSGGGDATPFSRSFTSSSATPYSEAGASSFTGVRLDMETPTPTPQRRYHGDGGGAGSDGDGDGAWPNQRVRFSGDHLFTS